MTSKEFIEELIKDNLICLRVSSKHVKKRAANDIKQLVKIQKKLEALDILFNNLEIPLGENTCYLIDKGNLSKEENQKIEQAFKAWEEEQEK